jgi:hypothetical protein
MEPALQLLVNHPQVLAIFEDFRIGLDWTASAFTVAATIGLAATFWTLVKEA